MSIIDTNAGRLFEPACFFARCFVRESVIRITLAASHFVAFHR